ncbi:FAD/FMN-containing dehydrogenase [Halopelagius inordinatus]|uniref:D-lactate dehydrogenase (cytochrome) n=1 Tax=Halopelagius inordinatus TaxID=553467 RepID=A0A1I2V5W7_9EURY|nr:FAD-binding and (Fe-S)-binding domain-containing protein [Halopelagius inordinatus]SFG84443.1 FAD/FMN-containing dehydrogenase [Halopelagius inordinatus]
MAADDATPGDSVADPTADPRANYDYAGGDVARPGVVSDLEGVIEGDVRFDDYSRQLYATDASSYEMTPVGVVFPCSTADASAVVEYCAEREIPVLPRGGGTSLAGQAVNEAVVLDFARYMDDVLDASPRDQTARVQAGATLARLNDTLSSHGLKFAPDPAAGNRSTVGGAIGNNSTGAHSLKYGKTDAYVEECEVVLADGTVATFGEVSLSELRARADADGGIEGRIYDAVRRVVDEEADAVREVYPQLKRNVSGYNLDRVVEEAESGAVNVARVFAGSEGTLGVVTEATVSLEPIPETKSVALLTYRDLLDAMADVDAIVRNHDPAAVEAIDDVLIELARDTEEFADVAAMLPEETETALLVEFYAEDDAHRREQVRRLVADRVAGRSGAADGGATGDADGDADPVRAFDALEAYEESERARLWKLRKSGMPILLSRTSDAKHISFIEDTAVPTENLAEYVADFREVLADNDTFASFYAHAGPGCMHMRPLVDATSPAGVRQMEAISDAVTDLVVEYDGSVSGEHGDGRARTQWNRKLYGDPVWALFRDLKSAFDPDWLLNPGQVCGYAPGEEVPEDAPDRARAVRMTEALRFGGDYEFDAGFEPALNWRNENGFRGMAELCHGCGGCRGQQDTTGGVMCPTYRATGEESLSTRGRANLLRQAASGDLRDGEMLEDEFLREVMDLCIGCKGCKRDCPSEVDMAKLKAEVEHAHHEAEGASLRERLFADVDTLNAVGSALAPVSNWLANLPGSGFLAEKTLGIARERDLPTFHRESFEEWFEKRGGAAASKERAAAARTARGDSNASESEATRRALVFPDTYTNYNHPDAGKAAVRVLEAAGVRVRVPEGVTATGRPSHSKGFLDVSRERARTNVDALAPLVESGWDVVLVEPSDAVMLQSDYLDLLSGTDAERVAAHAYGVCEYLDRFGLDSELAADAPDETLTYHGHCHQKATKKDGHAAAVLEAVGYDVDALDSGCCGMAGSFGYEAEHYSLSQSIADVLLGQIGESEGDAVVAPGASCRTQLGDRTEETPPHPVEKIAAAIER